MENALFPSPSSEVEVAARVSSLFVYPIKSCKGISLSQAALTPTGIKQALCPIKLPFFLFLCFDFDYSFLGFIFELFLMMGS